MESRVLVDSSVWIDFINDEANTEVQQLSHLLSIDGRICICPTVIQEVLQGINVRTFFERVKENLLIQEILICEPVKAAVEAAKLYQSLREKGATIRKSNDCLIAYHALSFGAKVLHRDRDFEMIAKHSDLLIFKG
jgi:predicted nucleic acid-binding protein